MKGWGLRQPPGDLAERWRAEGWWDERTLGQVIADGLAERPGQGVVVHSTTRPSRTTYADLAAEARRLAGGLATRGIGPGDVVALQLPNWREAVATIWGAAFLGAVIVPIVHFYGRREVDHILERTEVKVLFTTARFGRLDYLSDAAERPALKSLDTLVVVGDGPLPEGALAYETLLESPELPAPLLVDPGSPALVAYTSGTTSDPKGVVHSHRTLGAEIRQVAGLVSTAPRKLTVSPIGHVGGMLTGAMVPVVQGAAIDLLDAWDTDRVLDLMSAEGLAAGSGATFFLTSLLDHPRLSDRHLELMHHISLGGAAVPYAVARRATDLGIVLTRNYGASEHPTITGSRHHDPEHGRITTDGRAMPGVELRIVGPDGRDVGPGEPGEIWSRGPDCFIGYTDPELTDKALDPDGWYHTEDIGILDPDGNLSITDRLKDIIIRGGENISAAEVEGVLAALPQIAEIAVVGVPDDRFGEHPAAYVRLRDPASAPTLADLRDGCRVAGLGRQKWPEDLIIVEDFPRTPSGKIKKRALGSA